MAGSQDDIPPPPPPSPSQTPTQQTPHTVSTIKLPILKKGEYDIWAMKMEHYLAHTDYPIWEVIQNGNGPVSITTDTQGQIKVLPPRTAEEILARERERKARTTLLMALPEDHLAKFHKMTDAKEMWEAIRSRFGGNDESKKMQKYILKQQFEGFSVSNSEGLHKGHVRSLPSAWSQVSLIMRTKPGVDSLNFHDMYNNLRVFENDVKGSTTSSFSTQNVAFVSENTSSTNNVSTAYGVSNPSGQNSQYEQTSSYSLLANQSSCPQLDHEDLEQLDEFDLEEMDLKWQVAMISMRMKKFYKKTGRKLQFDAKEPVGFDKTKVECYSCHKTGHFARECRTKGNQDSKRRDAWNSGNKDGRRSGKQEDSKALVTIDGEGVDWTSHSEEEEDYALMACNSSGSDTEVISCSKECKESYAELKKLYDKQRAQLSDASIEILSYTQALKKVEAQLVAHQQGQLWYEEKIRFMKIDLDDKTDVLTYHKKLLAEAEKEKEDLKAKVEKWHNSSKNLLVLLGEKGKLLLSPQQVVIGDQKDITGTKSPNTMVDQDYPHKDLQNNGNCDTWMFQNTWMESSHLDEYQDFNGGQCSLFEEVRCVTRRTRFYLLTPNVLFCLLNFKNIVPSGGLSCLIAKATINESNKWHRRLGHVNFKNLNKLVKGNLVRGLPSKIFQNDHTCVACQKGKQHKASCHKVANQNAGTEDNIDAGDSEIEAESAQDYFVLPIWSSYTSTIKSSKVNNAGEEPTKHPDFKQVDKEDQVFLDELERLKRQEQDANDAIEALRKEFAQETEDLLLQAGAAKASSTNIVNTASTPVSTASPYGGLSFTDPTNTDQDDSEIPALEEIYDNPTNGIFTNSSYDDEGAVADFTNLEPVVNVSPIPTSRINSIHPSTLILGDPQSAVQTRSKVTKSFRAHAFVSYIQKQRKNNHKDFQNCLFACFLSQNEPKKISEALEDESWVDAMQEELLQFKIQKV
ncbi:ribonuclease H-like domain-containing protein [Tanacetum coccineum]